MIRIRHEWRGGFCPSAYVHTRARVYFMYRVKDGEGRRSGSIAVSGVRERERGAQRTRVNTIVLKGKVAGI